MAWWWRHQRTRLSLSAVRGNLRNRTARQKIPPGCRSAGRSATKTSLLPRSYECFTATAR
ncbi:hypothetical protein I552_10272, partial [Mycobacterium xenopi 3993]